jgi:hypothetical protein
MNAVEQVQYESQVRMRYAIIAFLAALLIVGSQLIQLSGPHTSVDELTLDLITANKRVAVDITGATLAGIAYAALAVTLSWLNQITRARNPGFKPFVRWVAVAGALLFGTMGIADTVVIAIKAHQFVTTGLQTYQQANSLTTGGLIAVLPLLADLGSLLLAGGFIWIALNSLRVGLLTRFMGYLGVFAGALVLFPIGTFVPLIQGGWFVALALLFAGRLPSGTPPAWAAGTAIPWPPMGEPRQPRGAGRERPTRQRGAKPEPAPVAVVEATDDDDAGARTRANTPKRKRKRRH